MNERIRQLAVESGFAIGYDRTQTGKWSLSDRELEKFAELLLNEIANTAVIYDGYIDESRQLAVKLHLGDFRKRIPIIGD